MFPAFEHPDNRVLCSLFSLPTVLLLTQGESLQDMGQIQGSLEVASRSTWTALTNDSELQRYVPFALAGLYALLAVGTEHIIIIKSHLMHVCPYTRMFVCFFVSSAFPGQRNRQLTQCPAVCLWSISFFRHSCDMHT